MPMTPTTHDALLVVDVQNDFTPGGALAVPEGDEVVPVINRLLPGFALRVFTRDWHPPNHVSFSAAPEFRHLSWPPHCVQNTRGAEFHPGLAVGPQDWVVSKGDQPETEALSAFQGTDLAERLTRAGIRRVFVAGLATEYCVRRTAEDALRAGFAVVVIQDACRGIDSPAGSVPTALRELAAAGATLIASREVA